MQRYDYRALSFYRLLIQQARVLGSDEKEMEAVADKKSKTIIEGEVIPPKPKPKTKKKKSSAKNKRRK